MRRELQFSQDNCSIKQTSRFGIYYELYDDYFELLFAFVLNNNILISINVQYCIPSVWILIEFRRVDVTAIVGQCVVFRTVL